MHENTFSGGHFSAVDSARGHFQNIFSSTVDRLEEKIGSLKEEKLEKGSSRPTGQHVVPQR